MIAEQMLETGILQLGSFMTNGTYMPYRLRFDMLAAYPDLLQTLVDETPEIPPEIDRLLSASGCVPYASALSLKYDISLVYSRGSEDAAVYDLVGAYDVGHPTCLIVNTVSSQTVELIEKAAQGGLNVKSLLVLMKTTNSGMVDLPTVYVSDLADAIQTLKKTMLIPYQQAQTVLTYLAD